jgi:excisionase family DNA binding protein
MTMAEPAVYTVEEAARVLKVGRTAMYSAVRAGEVPGVIRVGRSIRISRHALERMLGMNGDGPARDRAASETTPAKEKNRDDGT